jgi:DNA-binding transcriptional ArsR family regulator
MNEKELALLHKALSVPVRLKILKLIANRPLCVKAITRFLGISQPAVSQHLAVLRRAGLVTGEKRGYMVHYSFNRSRFEVLKKAMGSFPHESLRGASVGNRKPGQVKGRDDR